MSNSKIGVISLLVFYKTSQRKTLINNQFFLINIDYYFIENILCFLDHFFLLILYLEFLTYINQSTKIKVLLNK